MGKVKKVAQDGGPNFLVRNVEKMVLGVVLLLFAVLVYTGYSLESLPSDRTPDKLVASAKQAKQSISNPENWKGIEPTLVIPTGFQQRLNVQQIGANVYELEKPFEPRPVQQGERRKDPILYAPEKVEATVVTGPLAYIMQRGEKDLLLEEPNSEHEVKKEPTPSPRKRRNADPYGGGEYGSGMSSGMRGMSSGGSGYGAPAGMSSGPGMSMPGMGMGMPGAEDPTATGPVIMADPQYRTGFRAGAGAIAKSETCVVVKALIPWKKQWDEYETKFTGALGYNPMRDTPRFLSFTAERAEVTDDPNAELVWEKITWTKKYLDELQQSGYYSLAQDVADPRYTYPWVLTMPIPPFIDRDLDKLALHSDVPKMKPQTPLTVSEQEKMAEEIKAKQKAKKEAAEKGKKPSDAPTFPGMGAQGGMPGMEGAMGGMGMSGMPGIAGAEGGMPGMGMPGMGMPGMGMPGMSMPGMGMGMPGAEGVGMPGMSMPGMGGSGYGGMSSYGGSGGMSSYGGGMSMPGMEGSGYDPSGMGMTVARGPQVPSLMIRFFDFSAEVGKKYRYRVQVYMEDPNHPMDARFEPLERYFDDEVKKRLAPQVAEEKTTKTRLAYRKTDFSEPSDIVSVEVPPQTIAGKIAPGRFAPLRQGGTADGPIVQIQTDEPTGKVMAVVWDAQRAADVPAVVDGQRGTALNFKAKADVIHPITLVFKALTDYQFETDHLLADIRGGEPLPLLDKSDKSEPLLTLGEYAYFDEKGQLHVTDELEDLPNFRKLALPEAPPSATVPGAMGADSGEMGMPGAETMGMPGGGEDPRANRGKKKKN